MNCKACKYWKTEQSELNYNKYVGICVSPELKFNTKTGSSVIVLDRNNLSNAHHKSHTLENISNGQTESSKYCLVTNEDFGCINFTKPQ